MARLSVQNTGEQRLTIRDLVIRRKGADPLVQRVGVIVPAGARADVPISLPPDTPPGEYSVEVELPHERRTTVIRVHARHELRVRPGRAVVPVGTSEITLSIENIGNVAARLAPVTASEEGELRLSLSKTPVIKPGQSTDIPASVVVDDRLDPLRRHEFDVPVGTSDVIFVVLPRAHRRRTSANPKQGA